MQSIFEELYSGNVRPVTEGYVKNLAYMEAVSVKNGYLDKLTATLNKSEKELLDKYSEARAVIGDMENFNTFSYALRFGILLMVEAFTKGYKASGESGAYEE